MQEQGQLANCKNEMKKLVFSDQIPLKTNNTTDTTEKITTIGLTYRDAAAELQPERTAAAELQ